MTSSKLCKYINRSKLYRFKIWCPTWRKVFSLSLHQWLDGGFGANNNFTWINNFWSVETEASKKYLSEYKRTIDSFACPDKNRGKLTIISKYRCWNYAKSAANYLFLLGKPFVWAYSLVPFRRHGSINWHSSFIQPYTFPKIWGVTKLDQ